MVENEPSRRTEADKEARFVLVRAEGMCIDAYLENVNLGAALVRLLLERRKLFLLSSESSCRDMQPPASHRNTSPAAVSMGG